MDLPVPATPVIKIGEVSASTNLMAALNSFVRFIGKGTFFGGGLGAVLLSEVCLLFGRLADWSVPRIRLMKFNFYSSTLAC